MAKRKPKREAAEPRPRQPAPEEAPAPAPPAWPAIPARWAEIAAWAAFGLACAFFLILKSFSLHWEVGDENVYFYMAWATAEHGALPYADYFFAHPPLHLLPGVLVFALLDFGPVMVRLIPVFATLVGALFLFLLARRSAGRLAAAATVFAYLCAFSLIRASTHWTGINLAVMWVCVGLWALFGRRHVLSGVAFALGVCTGNYVLPGAIMAGMLAVLDSRRAGLRFALGLVGPWLLVQVLGLAVGGKGYLDGVYRYHFLKPSKAGVSRSMFYRVFTDNFALFAGCVLAPVLAWLEPLLARASGAALPGAPLSAPRSGKPGESDWLPVRWWFFFRRVLLERPALGAARIGALWALGYVLFIALLPRVFPFYFLLLFPAMALCAGFAAARLIAHAVGLLRRARRERSFFEALAVMGVILAVLVTGYAVRVPVQRTLLPDYVRKHSKPMKWSGSPLPGVGSVLRSCCWDDVAEAYTEYGTVQEVLYHESRFFEQAGVLAEFVRTHTRPEQTIFGDSSTAGLVALLAGRRLAAHCADTNVMRFSSGVTDARELVKKIDTPELAYVLVSGQPVKDRSGRRRVRFGKFARIPAFAGWLQRDFQVAFQVRDRTKGWFYLLERRSSSR
ncbi:MAG: hypothetical protein JXR96_18550 [Deltaproteobacteria bacterium]|nr:hypothetical protein [Deltaproteobacteria bacterium]